jgi:phosphatidylserine decarboxylase
MWVYYLILVILVLLAAFVLFWKLYFLRDPHRDITPGNNLVSPADGKVIKIIEYNKEGIMVEKGVFGRISIFAKDVAPEGYLVSIFLSPLDVHINRAPMSGEVIYAKHYRGKFFNASNFEDSLQNERNEILIKDGKTKIKVIQLAGFLARRIECFVDDGKKILKGQRVGLINLGSQVSTIIPKSFEIKVKEGDRVVAGVTIIAEPK